MTEIITGKKMTDGQAEGGADTSELVSPFDPERGHPEKNGFYPENLEELKERTKKNF